MKLGAEALLDSNVLVAAVVSTHDDNEPSAALLATASPGRFALAAHSFAEAFVTLTKQGPWAAFNWTARDALIGLEYVLPRLTVVGLSPAQTADAVRRYAQAGLIGARVYDHLIGSVAVHHAIPRIITLNLRHMRSLFPALDVVEPADALTR